MVGAEICAGYHRAKGADMRVPGIDRMAAWNDGKQASMPGGGSAAPVTTPRPRQKQNGPRKCVARFSTLVPAAGLEPAT
ncbi:hypothetical protein CBM2634_U80010 [Cupriavidus taiwanensis]|uniref:Uncharacterized protein n=1 Tax=Cupriavidus taiwanensis TaxID=164546 RepID=A0A375JD82_9BURK|nr:hypothetical protein CBM2634_U80010 [Cupriavidus taiwanensis]